MMVVVVKSERRVGKFCPAGLQRRALRRCAHSRTTKSGPTPGALVYFRRLVRLELEYA